MTYQDGKIMNFDELLQSSLKILSINSVQSAPEEGAPFGKGVLDTLLFALGEAKRLGFNVKNLDGYAGYADIGEGKPFYILGHLDTVPIGSGWTKNPFGEISDGVIYGRGAVDDKLPTLACLFAAAELSRTKILKRKIRIIFGCNEESGWKCMERYTSLEGMPDEGFSPDADFPVIFCEKGIVNFDITIDKIKGLEISAGERANVVPDYARALYNGKEFEASGVSAHGSHPDEGVNAIVKLIEKLKDRDEKIKLLYERFSDCFGSGLNIEMEDDVSGRLTVNLGVAYCDEAKQHFVVDIRYPISVSEEEVLNRLKSAFPGADITKTHYHLPLHVDRNSNLVKTLLDVYKEVTGEREALPIAIGGGTYARAMKCGVAFGPSFPGEPLGIHCVNECIKIETFKKVYEIYKKAIERICF